MKRFHPTTRSNTATLLLLAIGTANAAGPSPIDPVGTYALRPSKERVTIERDGASPVSVRVSTGFAGVIEVTRIGPDRVLVDLSGNKGSPSFNQGSFTAILTYENDMATYTPLEYDRSCVVTLKWLRNAIVVSQRAEDANTACGFGHAVAVDGVYRKISSKRPKISTN
jgi:hypothetical protein